MTLAIVVFVGILLLAYLPQAWVSYVISANSKHRPEFPGTGGEFARYLLDEMKLSHVRVEHSDIGDHYDPIAKAVRLRGANMHGQSLSAVVIAAHEVGHAMQDAIGYAPLAVRTRMARHLPPIQMLGSVLIIGAPLTILVTKSPAGMILPIIGGVAVIGISVLMHVVTLPVEFDASFRRALPVLERGQFLNERDMRAARRILWAAALTYVAGAAMSLLNAVRWIRVFR